MAGSAGSGMNGVRRAPENSRDFAAAEVEHAVAPKALPTAATPTRFREKVLCSTCARECKQKATKVIRRGYYKSLRAGSQS